MSNPLSALDSKTVRATRSTSASSAAVRTPRSALTPDADLIQGLPD